MERIEIAQVKFKVVFTGQSTPALAHIDELITWCRLFHEKGLTPSYGQGSSGNLSFRLAPEKNEFIITASALPKKDTLDRNDFVVVHRVDRRSFSVEASGTKNPSSESTLHHAIYEKRPEVNAIFHGHCARILDSAARLRLFETKREEEYGTLALVDHVISTMGTQNFIVMKNHGFLSLGTTMALAGDLALDIYSKT